MLVCSMNSWWPAWQLNHLYPLTFSCVSLGFKLIPQCVADRVIYFCHPRTKLWEDNVFRRVFLSVWGGGAPCTGSWPLGHVSTWNWLCRALPPRLVQLEVHCIGTPTRFSNLFPLKCGLLVSEHLNSTEMVVRFTMYISRKNAANPRSIFTSNLEFIMSAQTW